MGFPALSVDNPLLIKELRSRMRGAKAYWLLFVYLTLLSLAVTLAYLFWWQSGRYGDQSFIVGRVFFQTLFCVQVGLVCLVAPGLTAGCITIEKEQRTYDLLAGSPMPAKSIVIGKLISATSFVLLLTVCSLPLVSVSFLLGGVSPGEVLSAYLVLILTAFLYASIGLAWSSIARNTATATIMTYLTVMAVFFHTVATLSTATTPGGHGFLAAVNPIGALIGGVSPERYYGFTVPAWLPSLILNLLAGILLATIAVRRFDSYSTDDSPALRIMSLLLYSSALFFVFGGISGLLNPRDTASLTEGIVIACWCVAISAVLAAIPIYATGEGARGSLYGLLVRSWRNVLRPRVESSFPFTILLIAIPTLMIPAGFLMSRTPFPADLVPGFILALLVALTACAAWALIAIVVSRLLKSRWSALAVVYLIMGVCILLPLTTMTTYPETHGAPVPFNAFRLTLYLNPQMAAWNALSADTSVIPDPSRSGVPFAPVTILLYALIGSLAAVKLRHIPAESSDP